MNYERTLGILRELNQKGYSILDLCAVIECAAKNGAFSELEVEELSTDEKIEQCMRELMVPNYMKGWGYTLEVVKLCIQNSDQMLKEFVLFEQVAEKHKITASAVERSIRTVTNKAIEKANPDVLYRYFGEEKITPKQFYVGIARMVQKRL